jgi:predicted DNA-binding protein
MAATRLEVRIPEQLNDRLEALAAEEGMTKTDIFRRALAVRIQGSRQPAVNFGSAEPLTTA